MISTSPESPDFLRCNAFATVLKTMEMFEEDDTLGRRLRWGFDGPQLLIVPVAGEWANAFYERESRSLQFYYFRSQLGPPIYTSLSHDIVSHETGHAILDGIAPDLYHAFTPQSLALHEGIADLVALVMAFRNDTLRKTVLDQTQGSIANITAFSSVAEEFGQAQGKPGALRQFVNEKTLDPKDEKNLVDPSEPHELSQVLTGALYTVMVKIHEALKKQYSKEDGATEFSSSGKALFVGAERFKRMIFRALDYLPPGEISFADYGRAIIASDQASHPTRGDARGWMRKEFVRRCMAKDLESLEVEEPIRRPGGAGARPPHLRRQRLGRVRLREPQPRAAADPAGRSPSASGRASTRARPTTSAGARRRRSGSASSRSRGTSSSRTRTTRGSPRSARSPSGRRSRSTGRRSRSGPGSPRSGRSSAKRAT